MPLEETLRKFQILEKSETIGKLRKLLNFTDEPKFFQYSCSYENNPYDEEQGGVSTDVSEINAKVKALGECIERYCLENIFNPLIEGTYEDLSPLSLNPGDFVNFRNEDMNYKKSQYLEKLKKIKFLWVKGREINSGSNILIPAQLIYVPFSKDEPIIRPQVSTGAAAHEDINEAIYRGTLEIIERDSFMIRYLSQDKLPQIILEGDLKKLEEYFKRYHLDLSVFETTTDLEVPSYMCINEDRTGEGPAVSVGLSSGLDIGGTIYKSIMESQQVRQWIRYSYIQDKKPLIISREQIRTIKDRGYFWYSLNMVEKLFFLNNGQKRMSKHTSLDNLDLMSHLGNKGIDIYMVNITSSKIAGAGFSVVKVVSPQLHPLFLYEEYPCLYSERLKKNLNGRKINPLPHPFM